MAFLSRRFLASAGVLGTLCFGPAAVHADVLPPDTKGVPAEMVVAWGPIADRLAREVAVSADDTWASLAQRTCADARFAGLVRAMNGGGEAPPRGSSRQPATAWVPPAGRAFDATDIWYSAYLDCAKFGPEVDVSRTGLRRLAPTRGPHRVFGTVTVALLAHRTDDDAARSSSLPRERAREALRAKGAKALVVAPSFQATTTVAQRSKVARFLYEVRCDGIEGDSDPTLGLRLVSTTAFDAENRALSAADLEPSRLRLDGPAGALAAAAMALAMLHVTRRRPASPPPAT